MSHAANDGPGLRSIALRWAIWMFGAAGLPIALDAYTNEAWVAGRVFLGGLLVFHVAVVSTRPRTRLVSALREAVGFALAALPAAELVRGMVGAPRERLLLVAGMIGAAHLVGRALGLLSPRVRLAIHGLLAALVAWPLIGYVGRETFAQSWGGGPLPPVVRALDPGGENRLPVIDPVAGAPGEGRLALGGAVRPGAIATLGATRPWGVRWPGGWVRGDASVSFPWPARGAVSLEGGGAPASSTVQRCGSDIAILAIAPGVALNPERRDRIASHFSRTVRWIEMTEDDARSVATLSSVDAIVVDRVATLQRSPAAFEWVALGGRAIVATDEPGDVGPIGFGRAMGVGPRIGFAKAAVRPPRPPAPPRPPGPARAWPLLLVALLALGVGTGRVRIGALAVVAVGALAWFTVGDPWWTLREARVYWCQSPGVSHATGHRVDHAWPRGPRRVALRLPAESAVATLPLRPTVAVAADGVDVTWSGAGGVASLQRAALGGAIGLRTSPSGDRLAVGWRAGLLLEPAFFLSPRGIERIAPLHAGVTGHLSGQRVAASDLPESIAQMVKRFPPPPATGAIIGILHGLDGSGPFYAPLDSQP